MASANLGRVSFVPEGTYDSAKSYVRLSVVNFNTGTYVSKMDVPAGTDPSNTNYWMPLIAINSGGGGGGGGTAYALPIADATTLGGVMPVAKTQDMSTPVGVDANGRLYATDAPAATLVVEINQSSRATYSASEIDAAFQSGKSVTLLYTGHVFQYVGLNASKAEFVGVIVNDDGVSGVTIGVNEDKTLTVSGVWYNYTLPTASESTLGGVKPVTKTSAMTQPVGVDAQGALFTVPGGGGGSGGGGEAEWTVLLDATTEITERTQKIYIPMSGQGYDEYKVWIFIGKDESGEGGNQNVNAGVDGLGFLYYGLGFDTANKWACIEAEVQPFMELEQGKMNPTSTAQATHICKTTTWTSQSPISAMAAPKFMMNKKDARTQYQGVVDIQFASGYTGSIYCKVVGR